MKISVLPLLLLSCLALSAPLQAAAAQGGPAQTADDRGEGRDDRRPAHQPPGPPPEALEACKGKSAGAVTTLKTPDGKTVSGSCQLVFHPDRPPAGDRQKP